MWVAHESSTLWSRSSRDSSDGESKWLTQLQGGVLYLRQQVYVAITQDVITQDIKQGNVCTGWQWAAHSRVHLRCSQKCGLHKYLSSADTLRMLWRPHATRASHLDGRLQQGCQAYTSFTGEPAFRLNMTCGGVAVFWNEFCMVYRGWSYVVPIVTMMHHASSAGRPLQSSLGITMCKPISPLSPLECPAPGCRP